VNTLYFPMPFPVAIQPLDCMGLGNILCSKCCLSGPHTHRNQITEAGGKTIMSLNDGGKITL